MTAHAYAPAGSPRQEPGRQARLFALPGGAAAAAPEPERPPQRPPLAPVSAPALPREAPAERSLDSELRLAWTALAAGAPAACIMCGGRIEPHDTGSGGACTSCGTTLD